MRVNRLCKRPYPAGRFTTPFGARIRDRWPPAGETAALWFCDLQDSGWWQTGEAEASQSNSIGIRLNRRTVGVRYVY